MRLPSLSLALLLAASSSMARAADLPTVKKNFAAGNARGVVYQITMNGEAEDSVKPDYAILRVEAANVGASVAAATIENAKVSKSLLALLEKYHLEGADVEAGALTVVAQYRERKLPNSESVENVLIGYRAATSYRVQIRDLDAAPRIAREILQSGGNFYSGMSFELRDRTERLTALRDKALRKALEDGRRFAEVAGVKLGDILQIMPLSGGALIGARADGAERESFSAPARVEDVPLRAAVEVTWELKSEAGCSDGAPAK